MKPQFSNVQLLKHLFPLIILLAMTGCRSLGLPSPVDYSSYSSHAVSPVEYTPPAMAMSDSSSSVADDADSEPADPPPQPTMEELRGCTIVGDDGEVIGYIDSKYSIGSFVNPDDIFGRSDSPWSIWNEDGLYGWWLSDLSPFSASTNTPPRIVAPDGHVVAYLSINNNKLPAVNPNDLADYYKW